MTLRSRFAQRSLIFFLTAVFLLAAAWIGRTYIANRLSHTLTIHNLHLASRYDPGNAAYHLQLGRLYQYSVTNARPKQAVEQFRRAVELNSYDPQAWLNLAAALEFEGQTAQAEKYLNHASTLAPYLPIYQWTVGNYFLLHGNTQEAFRHLKVVLAGSREYDQTVFNVAWKSSGNANQILQELIPYDLAAEFSYLDYLTSLQKFPDAAAVWQRIADSPKNFDPQQTAAYIDALLRAHHPAKAYQVWSNLESRGLIRKPSDENGPNLITNGDFEDNLSKMGFGWRIIPVDGVYAGLDTSTFHSPGHSLAVQFSGKQNLDYRQIYQFVKVSPNRNYHLQAFIKTEGITTDSGPRLEVRDAYNPPALDKFSEDATGTSQGWNPVNLDFKAGPKTDLIIVALARLPIQKIDNQIAGRVWLDDVVLTPLPASDSSTP
ncbi:MAG TPA: tetratricopeptide repeat protein [Terriglobia bacterium]|nr:tetratricopeptide repeat protein [Terriglobia bacterium]